MDPDLIKMASNLCSTQNEKIKRSEKSNFIEEKKHLYIQK